jgi:hypothetical protein
VISTKSSRIVHVQRSESPSTLLEKASSHETPVIDVIISTRTRAMPRCISLSGLSKSPGFRPTDPKPNLSRAVIIRFSESSLQPIIRQIFYKNREFLRITSDRAQPPQISEAVPQSNCSGRMISSFCPVCCRIKTTTILGSLPLPLVSEMITAYPRPHSPATILGRDFSSMLTTVALDHSSLRRFEACSCKPPPRTPPSCSVEPCGAHGV